MCALPSQIVVFYDEGAPASSEVVRTLDQVAQVRPQIRLLDLFITVYAAAWLGGGQLAEVEQS